MNPLAVFAIVCNCAIGAVVGGGYAHFYGVAVGVLMGLAVFIALTVIYALCAPAAWPLRRRDDEPIG